MSFWHGPRPPVGTLAEMVEGIRKNVDEARGRLAQVKEQLVAEPPGKHRDALESERRRCIYDIIHWKEYTHHYRARVAKEGPDVVPAVWGGPPAKRPAERKPERPTPTPAPPREEATDDELPF